MGHTDEAAARSATSGVLIPLAVVLVVFTVVRNLPMMPFHWLNSATS